MLMAIKNLVVGHSRRKVRNIAIGIAYQSIFYFAELLCVWKLASQETVLEYLTYVLYAQAIL
jgi:hypothetical protein